MRLLLIHIYLSRMNTLAPANTPTKARKPKQSIHLFGGGYLVSKTLITVNKYINQAGVERENLFMLPLL